MSKQTKNQIDVTDLRDNIYACQDRMDAIAGGATRTRSTRWHNHVSIHDFNRVRAFLENTAQSTFNNGKLNVPIKRYRVLSAEIPSLPKILGQKLTKTFDACSVAE